MYFRTSPVGFEPMVEHWVKYSVGGFYLGIYSCTSGGQYRHISVSRDSFVYFEEILLCVILIKKIMQRSKLGPIKLWIYCPPDVQEYIPR